MYNGGTMPLSGCKGTANRRQYKIKKELFSFLLKFRMWFKYGLKAQKLLAQGNALG